MPNRDNRSDNVPHLQEAIEHTMENMREAEDFVQAHGQEMDAKDKADIEAKNRRREEAIHGFRSEIQDEVAYQRNEDESK